MYRHYSRSSSWVPPNSNASNAKDSSSTPYTPSDRISGSFLNPNAAGSSSQSPSSSTLAISPVTTTHMFAPVISKSNVGSQLSSEYPNTKSGTNKSGSNGNKSDTLDGSIFSSSSLHNPLSAYDTPHSKPNNGGSLALPAPFYHQSLSQVERLRLWRHDAIMQHHYQTAEYIGDKILALTNDPNDAFWLAQVFYLSGQYTRARQLLLRQELDRSVSCRYLAALCLTKMGKWEEALTVLGEKNPFQMTNPTGKVKNQDGGIKLEASMCFLRGQIYANQNNFDLAKECFKEAVQVDAKCFEAYDQLIRGSLLTPREEWELLNSLDFEESCGGDGSTAELVKALYATRLGKFENLELYKRADETLTTEYELGDNPDVLLSRSDLLFVQCRFKECLKVCEEILEKDKFRFSVMPNYLACLHELGKRNQLFLIAHELVDNHPDEAVSWLAVGVYYLTIGKILEARRYFSKSSMMSPFFGQAWIGFAHTFAVEGEHEQAISAYSSAARLFQGTHLPSLFLGMQHLQLNNLVIANEYLHTAYSICRTDPLLLNELGVVCYHKNELAKAEAYFKRADQASVKLDSDPRGWLSIKANLGHVYRRLGDYQRSLDYFEQVLRITPQDANIYSAMGLANLELGNTTLAIENFHEALSISPTDTVATDLLKRALDDCSSMGFADITRKQFPALAQIDEAVENFKIQDDEGNEIAGQDVLNDILGTTEPTEDDFSVPKHNNNNNNSEETTNANNNNDDEDSGEPSSTTKYWEIRNLKESSSQENGGGLISTSTVYNSEDYVGQDSMDMSD